MTSTVIPRAGAAAPAVVNGMPAQSSPARANLAQGKGLTTNDALRRMVIRRAKAYRRPACNRNVRTPYIYAATRYAETLIRAAGCNDFRRCRLGEGMLADVWRLNRSQADLEVARAMAAAHRAGGLSERNFRGGVRDAVRVIAGANFKPGPGPSCIASRSVSRRWMTRAVARGVLSSMKRRRWSRFRFRFRR